MNEQEEVKVEEKEILDEPMASLETGEEPAHKKKRSIGGIIMQVFIWLLSLFILANIAVGLVNFNQIRQDKEPYLVLSQETKTDTTTKITSYRFGLYKIIKTETNQNISISLRFFFQDDKTLK